MPSLTEYLALPEATARYGYRSESILRTAACSVVSFGGLGFVCDIKTRQ